ncbi:glyoxalase/bleomycin resistance protein/dioxygenase [Capsaspora owczarzaki ATCC 30864]|uniref:Glyoxalase/bleomycin resistance protein/dioxygenase n=1 Tax=Capsaspora owczarzaki (strain ATCC 30864) TaxID=595528 RepID=A0A0D2VIX5_CAPO3|nr:glyoxalase/bleomycin resistance protein/dioxygenase [Capsaspora owczarzaki ATCC 30864]KJE89942.1 glyoxalase/bleomycin resistance protein/dioxygenase [Capsaspora owczarzaki ATCC 30864]|eukprot:XP_004349860.2 glyoxalase/bleomycin resistance protein/dioxygenase [Capsaspora owczarzaki ATCC 30864]
MLGSLSNIVSSAGLNGCRLNSTRLAMAGRMGLSFATGLAANSARCASTGAAAGAGAAAAAAAAAAALQPFHLAIPVNDLAAARAFYGGVLNLKEGRSSAGWQDYDFYGHQLVIHQVTRDYRGNDYFNPVDGDQVPIAHFGVVLNVAQFHDLAQRLQKANTEFLLKPHVRFQGLKGEQWTMFFKDVSGNNLEFKALTNPDDLFTKFE